MRRSPSFTSRLRLFGFVRLLFSVAAYGLVSCGLAACATQAPIVDAPKQAQIEQVLTPPTHIPADVFITPAEEFLRLSPGMKQLVARYVPEGAPDEEKLEILIDLFRQHPDYMIAYDATATLSAAETFRLARGNCLSFSAMFIAVAREAGLDVHFQEVDTPATWDSMSHNVLVQYRHINVAVGSRARTKGVVDFRIERYNRSYPQRVVSDDDALGHYYSNIGMDRLFSNNLPEAYAALRQAAMVAPNKSFIWNNMGIVQKRLGNLALAEVSYRQALQVDPADLTALTNLAGAYEEMGQLARAAELRDYGYQIKLRDPYFRYALAENAFKVGEYDEALRQLDAALRGLDVDHRFYYLRGLSFWELGDQRAAIDSVRKAIRVATKKDIQVAADHGSVGRYERTLQEWTEVY